MRGAAIWGLAGGLLVACAPGARSAPAAVAAPATARSIVPPDGIALALREGGYRQAGARAAARRQLRRALAPALAEARQVASPRDRGRALLQALYTRGPLRTYRADASQLKDVLRDGSYNCVSSTLLFMLAAAQLDLDVKAELLPTHARALLLTTERDGVHTTVVETTSPRGFSPSAALQAEARARAVGPQGPAVPQHPAGASAAGRSPSPPAPGGAAAGEASPPSSVASRGVAPGGAASTPASEGAGGVGAGASPPGAHGGGAPGARAAGGARGASLVAPGGKQVGLRGLIATMVVNQGSKSEQAGRLAEAEQLYARAARLGQGALRGQVLSGQRAAILAQLATAALDAVPPQLDPAFASLSRAVALGPAPPLGAVVAHNLRVVAARQLARAAASGGLDALARAAAQQQDAPLRPQDRVALAAHRLSHQTRLLAEAGRYPEAIAAVERALALPLAPEDRPLQDVLRQNRAAALRRAAQWRAARGDYAGALAWLRRAQPGPPPAEDHRRLALLAGAAHLKQGALEDAAAVYRAAHAALPHAPALKTNLVAALSRLALADDCAQAPQLLPELEELQGAEATGPLRRRCARSKAHPPR